MSSTVDSDIEKVEPFTAVDPKNSLSARLAGNSLWSLGGWAATMALSFVATPVTIRQLGAEAYGVLALLITVIAPLGLFDMGMGEATVKYMAESFGRNAPREAEAYLRSTMLFNLIVGLAGAVVIAVLANWIVVSMFNIPTHYHAMARMALYLVGLNWALTQISQTYVGALTALQRYRTISLATLWVQAGTLLVGIVVLLSGGNLLHLVISQSSCAGVAVIGWHFAAQAALPDFSFLPHWNVTAFRRASGMGIWQMVNKIGGLLSFRAQYWLLGASLPVTAVGYYNLGYQVVTPVYLIAFKVGQVVFPAVSHLQGQGRENDAARHTISATWICSFFGVSLITAVLCLAPDFLRLWVGEQVAQAVAPTLRVLALNNAVSMAFAVPNFYLLGTGRSHWLAVMAIFQGVITFGTAYLLLPGHGLIGAAWGVLAGAAVHVVVLILIWRAIMRRWIVGRVYFSAVFGPMLAGLLAGLLLAWLRSLLAGPFNWPELVGAGAVCTGATLVLILGIDSLLPGGKRRRQQLLELIAMIGAALGIRQFRSAHPEVGQL